ncbi:MAG: ABC transporter permease subunit [Bacillota bacterium]|nr:ABC transporter permease subunit [Bacillota bacterium]
MAEEILIASPLSTFSRLIELIASKDYWLSIFNSFWKIFFGLFLALSLGLIFAVLAFRFDFFRTIISLPISFLKSVPVAAFVIVLLFWISSRNLSIYIGFFMGLPIIYENTYAGFFQLDKKLVEMADSFKVPFKKRLAYLYRHQLLNFFKTAIISASGLIFKAGIAAELIGLQANSIGEKLYSAKIYLDSPDLFAWIISILFFSMVFEKFLKWILR